MTGVRSLFALVAVGVAALLGGCASQESGDPGTTCRNFAFSLAVTTGGEATPLEAAEHFAAHNSVADLPSDGWTAGPVSRGGAEVRHGRTVLSTVQGTDDTWFVDGGTCV